MNGATAQLARFCADLRFEMLPAEVIERVRLLLLDTIGIAIRARWDPSADSTLPQLRGMALAGLTSGSAHVLGDAAGYSPFGAALINGALAHTLDFDDTHAPAGLHASAPVMAAAFAAAEIAKADMRAVIAGIVAGYECMTRISLALGPDGHSDKGFHLTATCGVFAAAAAAGNILGLSGAQMEHAFGTCLSQTAGSGQFLVNGAWTKRFQVGAAGANGLLSACLAREGYTGAAEAFEGRNGFFHLYGTGSEPERLTAGLGTEWETLRIAIKPYPCCRAIHAPIDALLALRAEHGLDLSDVESVRIGMPRKCVDITGAPEDRKRNPASIVDAQFSAHFGVTAALEKGSLGWEDYETQLANPRIREFLPFVSAYNDPQAQAEYPDQLSGSIEVKLKDGATLRQFVRVPLGEPENMLTIGQLRHKFRSLVEPYIGAAGEADLFRMISGAPAEGSVQDLFAAAGAALVPSTSN